MNVKDCISCGNCVDFALGEKCPTRAFVLVGVTYKIAFIDQDLCINCGRCKEEIDCLNEAIA